MTIKEIKNIFIDYFKEKNHQVIKSASLIPENDPSVLFTTAGMHPLVPYLLGEKHPAGKRLVNVQKCLRTADIDEVGDESHLTFFEMLGNWSLGDYFKNEAIEMSYDLLVNHLHINPQRLVVTVFAGDDAVPSDNETYEIWKKIGLTDDKIFFCDREHNWWGPVGLTGPCGPDTEIFYDTLKSKCSDQCGPTCNCGKYIEIWNNVFMEYNKLADGTYALLKQKNVDTGMGVERILLAVNDCHSVYNTEAFKSIIEKIEVLANKKYGGTYDRAFRIVADHIKAATFILGDERAITPSNTDQGYILRRLIRRACRYLMQLEITQEAIGDIALIIINQYGEYYPELINQKDFIIDELIKEARAFKKTLSRGLKEFNKIIENNKNIETLTGDIAFRLYDTYGFPLEMTIELCKEKNIKVDIEGFHARFKQHQELSRVGAEKKFRGGLADNSEETTKLHTATHLLHATLRKVLGNTVYQRGSNINSERLRFDFSFDRKLTPEEIAEVETLVNRAIEQKLDVIVEEKSLTEAKQDESLIGLFAERYGEVVKIYRIGDFSAEICGGPHVKNTSELGKFKIIKEESSSAGVRRIKAILE
jgi:alanyl-tRNA synthetase